VLARRAQLSQSIRTMRIGRADANTKPASGELPLWPPLLATRGPGGRSREHRHHAMHFIACLQGHLRVRVGRGAWSELAPALLTAPDVEHAVDASNAEVLLVFIEPESRVGAALRQLLHEPVRLFSPAECAQLDLAIEQAALLGPEGERWTGQLLAAVGGQALALPPLHPRVRKLLSLLRERPEFRESSLETLAAEVGLSPSRLMHAFTESIGVPLRPYLAWLRVQRAAALLVSGAPLARCALEAGFADAAHMTRTFRRMLGVAPSELRPGARAGARRHGW